MNCILLLIFLSWNLSLWYSINPIPIFNQNSRQNRHGLSSISLSECYRKRSNVKKEFKKKWLVAFKSISRGKKIRSIRSFLFNFQDSSIMDQIWRLKVHINQNYPFLGIVFSNLKVFRTFLIEKTPEYEISDPKNL